MPQSFASKHGVKPNEKVFVVGNLKFSHLGKKSSGTYPQFDITIENPRLSNVDGSHEGNFIDALIEGYGTYHKSGTTKAGKEYKEGDRITDADGNKVMTLQFKDSPNQPFVNIAGHAEKGKIVPANELLTSENGDDLYLTQGQPVKVCVRSYEYDNKFGQGVTQSINYIEIASVDNPQVSGGNSVNINEGEDPFGDIPVTEDKPANETEDKSDNPFDGSESESKDSTKTTDASGKDDTDLPF